MITTPQEAKAHATGLKKPTYPGRSVTLSTEPCDYIRKVHGDRNLSKVPINGRTLEPELGQ